MDTTPNPASLKFSNEFDLKTIIMIISSILVLGGAAVTFFNKISVLENQNYALNNKLVRIEQLATQNQIDNKEHYKFLLTLESLQKTVSNLRTEMLSEISQTAKGQRFTKRDGDILGTAIKQIEKRLEKIEDRLSAPRSHYKNNSSSKTTVQRPTLTQTATEQAAKQ